MSFFSSIGSGLSKAFSFLTVILTKTAAVDKTLVALAPTTKAALLATFYDVVKVIGSATEVATAASQGNIAGAIVLSEATVAMIQVVIADGKADVSTLAGIVTALKDDVTNG